MKGKTKKKGWGSRRKGKGSRRMKATAKAREDLQEAVAIVRELEHYLPRYISEEVITC